MAKTDNLTDFLTGVANAIRTKKGTTAKINPQNFETEIGSITTSKPEQEKTAEPTNTEQIISPDNGKVLSKVIIHSAPLPDEYNDRYKIRNKCLVDTVNDRIVLGSNDDTIDIPTKSTAGLQIIDSYAFYGCNKLRSVTITYTTSSVGEGAFLHCYNLRSVKIVGNDLTSIGDYAFSSCSELTNITLPTRLSSIGASAFSNCIKLTSITMLSTTPPTLGSNAFHSNVTTITVPAGCGNAYKTADGWSAYADKIVEATA